MSNITVSKNQHQQIQKSFNDASQQYEQGLHSPIVHRTNVDEFNEVHSIKLSHILIIAGIKYIWLKNYQQNERPFSDFVISS